jgi:hypothetical protein
LSTFITAETINSDNTSKVIQIDVILATGGTGIAITAEVGDWNSSSASGKESSFSEEKGNCPGTLFGFS